jgi:streptogramin lyase
VSRIVFTELLGGRTFQIEDLDESSLTPIGEAPLASPSGPAIHPNGAVLVAETGSHGIALAAPGDVWQRLGTPGSGVGEFHRPVATAFLADSLVVLDAGNARVVVVDDIGAGGWTSFGHRGQPTPGDPAEGAFADPRGLAIDTLGRIWVSDPSAKRLTRIDAIDGSGWTEIALPASVSPALPYGLGAVGDGVAVVDVGNRRILVIDAAGGITVIDLADGSWVAPVFVTGAGANLVAADVAANELRLLEPDGASGVTVVARLRGTPPDLIEPLFDSLGGVGS